ncbi:sensor histidine kinase [Sphingomonas silueang]|uniref:sensor histidine kinase n=1 Tax=Sphingomonas silueang TaxID=3156617 RepID=UPI0032B42609
MDLRFDDSLDTVLASDLSGEGARASAWRQLVDLIGRRRAPADRRAIALLADLQDRVPRAVRMASARDLEHARPPLALVELLAGDVVEVALPVLRGADLHAEEWRDLIPRLSPAARGVVRNRRDIAPEVRRLLDSYGPVDLVLPDAHVPEPVAPPEPIATEPLFFGDDVAEPEPEPMPSGPFSIVDVMARIEAFERNHDTAVPAAPPPPAEEGFRFESDAMGMIRWVEGVRREALIGMMLDSGGLPAASGFDGVAAGGHRRRTAFRDARLTIGGDSDAAGEWRVSAVPVFDPASGRFTGHRGTARRPRRDERAGPVRGGHASGVAQLRQLVHELRTPAGAIAGFAEMIDAELLGPVSGVYRARAAAILDNARDLVGVIDDLDLAARIEGDALDLRDDTVALGPLFAGIAADLAGLCALRDTDLAIEPSDLSVTGDRRAVERLLARLLATLVSAGSPGEGLFVRTGAEGNDMVAIVVDRPVALAAWPGATLFDIDDGEADSALLGTGFALRLARNLARELGGTLEPGGATLTLRLPGVAAAGVGQARHR